MSMIRSGGRVIPSSLMKPVHFSALLPMVVHSLSNGAVQPPWFRVLDEWPVNQDTSPTEFITDCHHHEDLEKMNGSRSRPQQKRGRKSGEEILEQVTLALRHVGDLEYLEASSLGRLPGVDLLIEERYQRALYPVGFSIRALLLGAVKAVCREFEEIPRYQREVTFLRLYARSVSVVEISQTLGLSREHVSRAIGPRAVGMVAKRFLDWANSDEISPFLEFVEA